MKQHIDEKQFKSLSTEQQKKLFDWWYDIAHIGDLYTEDSILQVIECCNDEIDKEDCVPILSLGQLIEFLNEKQDYQFHIFRRTIDWKLIVGDMQYGKVIPGELCDFLWEAVKENLEANESNKDRLVDVGVTE